MPNQLKLIVSEIVSTIFIFLFIYTAVSKIISHDSFAAVLDRSPLLGEFSNFISWMIPLTEIFVSLLLIVPNLRRVGLLFSATLMSLFTLYIAYLLLFASGLPCSCGGVLNSLGWKEHLVFNICFTVLAFIGWRSSKKNKDFIAINRISRTPV
jgi:hypothetical protein